MPIDETIPTTIPGKLPVDDQTAAFTSALVVRALTYQQLRVVVENEGSEGDIRVELQLGDDEDELEVMAFTLTRQEWANVKAAVAALA